MDAKRSPQTIALLEWYAANRRRLPWRALPGETPDAYRVWLSEVMLQQTTVATVRPRFEAWIARWPTLASLAAAGESEVMAAWAGLGYYARARNLVACARAVMADHTGRFPETEAELRRLPGLGDYTAAAIAGIAFGQPAVIIDTNVARVVARVAAILEPTPATIRAAAAPLYEAARAGDVAQALMDLGATICTPRAPRCLLCPMRPHCAAYATGTPEAYPARRARAAKLRRHATAFWLERDAHILLVTRPPRGLLANMRALPLGPIADKPPGLEAAPVAADWHLLDETVRHGFTHFHLTLALATAIAPPGTDPQGEWWPIDELARAGLPTLFSKAATAILTFRSSPAM